ncbi:hypothetical protein NF27_IP00060 [Candidatus Jidaibacter acanthamoeba]|uniref:Conjugal transfer protein TraH n=1 Tax=Candidatus Jidaibacter acanthamoebae TaxID=86105 RepID=A0A0C1QJ61_9RICK|nr:conjugal transfer protein TraH [Candidatus Jidaibacter acanthamoeba]KIE04238.1 hypothetical protein NF27_IP00060 [Candidatus Jidaibacter acanthamoeba]
MKRIISLSIILSLSLSNAYAGAGEELKGINKELSNVWSALGTETVTNSARYYKGQQRGHYTMGSMYFARKKKNRPLVSVNFPEIDLDRSCYSQGVLNFGGISFISGDELKNKMQNIVQQAGMMFAYLGVSSISPVVGETLQEVYSKLQELGGFLADECQAAKQIVSFAGDQLSQHSAVAKDIFTKVETGAGSKKDLSSAYKDFPKGKTAALNKAATKDERLTVQDINIAWKALEKLSGSADKELKELMMTISGTIIIKAPKNDSDAPSYQYISSTVTSPGLLEAMLKGSKSMKVLKCAKTDTKCLSITEADKFIDEKESFEHKVSEYFDKFKEALQKDEELAEADQKFLAKAGVAAFKNYDVIFQYTNANPEYEQGILVEIVAWNILYNYLSDILKEVNEAANNLQLAANDELKEFRNSVKSAQKLLADFEMKDMSRYKLQLFLVKRSENMEQIMADETAQILSMARN